MAVDEIVLHIGMQKAGSTAIQQALWNNAAWLRDRSIHVVRAGTPDLHAIHTDLFNRKADHDDAIAEELAALDDRSWTVVMSTEEIWGMGRAELAGVRERLCRWFPAARVEVVAYLRNHCDARQSGLFQAIRGGALAPSTVLELHQSLPEISPSAITHLVRYPALEFAARLRDHAAILDPTTLTTRVYDRAHLIGGDTALDFLAILGLDADADFAPCPAGINRSLRLEGVAVLAELDDRAIHEQQRLDVIEAVRSYSAIGGQRSIFRRSTQLMTEALFIDDYRALIADYPHLDGVQISRLPAAQPLDSNAVAACRDWVDEVRRVPFVNWSDPVDAGPHIAPASTTTTTRLRFRTAENAAIRWGRPLRVRLDGGYIGGSGSSRVTINGHALPDTDLTSELIAVTAPMYRPGWILELVIEGSPLVVDRIELV